MARPGTFDVDTLVRTFPLEERLYRHRCVEAWAMAVPWTGFPLRALLERVKPLSSARHVQFVSFFRPQEAFNQGRDSGLPWPYFEALRLDEAAHPLTLLATGIYGAPLPAQHGAPIRLVVPWKYGFKSIKSIVKIRFVEKQPPTTWNISAANEYGFYSNVNPERDHPRWSQKRERRIGEGIFAEKHETLMFNGYADQVASLYTGMDLRKNF